VKIEVFDRKENKIKKYHFIGYYVYLISHYYMNY